MESGSLQPCGNVEFDGAQLPVQAGAELAVAHVPVNWVPRLSCTHTDQRDARMSAGSWEISAWMTTGFQKVQNTIVNRKELSDNDAVQHDSDILTKGLDYFINKYVFFQRHMETV